MKILLIHQYAGNKGDRAVAYALSNLIFAHDKFSSITISTSNLFLWKSEPFFIEKGIKFIPGAWDFNNVSQNKTYWKLINSFKKYTFTILRELYVNNKFCCLAKAFINPSFKRAVKEADVIISVGGHHFTTILSRDLVSFINYDAMATLLLKKPLICFSQSFGPFEFHNQRNKILTKKILEVSKLYLRERQSRDCLMKFGVGNNNIHMTYESVLSLNKLFPSYIIPSQREKWIGIAIYATQRRTPQEHEAYIQSISEACNYFIQKGYLVRFFPMELKGTGPDDRNLINEIIDQIEKKEHCYLYEQDMTTLQHISEVAKCRIFIGHKTHSTIFALTCGTPLVGIAYHSKTLEFMIQYEMENYCIDDKILSSQIIIEKVVMLEKNLDMIGEQEYLRSKEISDIITSDFNSILNND